MADTTLIYVGAEAGNLYRKGAGQTHWEDLVANGLPPSPEARAIAVTRSIDDVRDARSTIRVVP